MEELIPELDRDFYILKSQIELAGLFGGDLLAENPVKRDLLVRLAELGQVDAIAAFYERFAPGANNVVDENFKKLDFKHPKELKAKALYEFSQRNNRMWLADIDALIDIVTEMGELFISGATPDDSQIVELVVKYGEIIERNINTYPFIQTFIDAFHLLRDCSDIDATYMISFYDFYDFILKNFPSGAMSLTAEKMNIISDLRRSDGVDLFLSYNSASNTEDANLLCAFAAAEFLKPFAEDETEFYRNKPKEIFRKLSDLPFSETLKKYRVQGEPYFPFRARRQRGQ